MVEFHLAQLESLVEKAFCRETVEDATMREAIDTVVRMLDEGTLRVVDPVIRENGETEWRVNEWVRKAILLYFRCRKTQPMESGIFHYNDKLALKSNFAASGVRVVPPAVARYGSYIEAGAILMPSYVNIGAYIGAGTLVDTWATVGSCAQVGRGVHLSGGVGIGGVLEPVQAMPVIIEDGCFLGSRCIVVEGVHVGKEAVLGANVVLTSSTHIVDVRGTKPVELMGYIPPRSVVIPGVRQREFPAGVYGVPCALIIGERKQSTDRKTSLNDALREYAVAV
ncbi:MAG: 2,3,4,5-tetrahydropyridine-2,6-dicarboxylate N-succinyltransferase [Bacteroidia bacterium]|nr:2,3,4,5-tetrahydropyridine-2,6-dicarboxylate N-succinyltransferase [Bacteroidia bacterium]